MTEDPADVDVTMGYVVTKQKKPNKQTKKVSVRG